MKVIQTTSLGRRVADGWGVEDNDFSLAPSSNGGLESHNTHTRTPTPIHYDNTKWCRYKAGRYHTTVIKNRHAHRGSVSSLGLGDYTRTWGSTDQYSTVQCSTAQHSTAQSAGSRHQAVGRRLDLLLQRQIQRLPDKAKGPARG